MFYLVENADIAKKTAVNRNACHLNIDIIKDIRDDFVKGYREKHPGDNPGTASTAFYEAINKLNVKKGPVTPKEGDGYIPSFCFNLYNKRRI